MGLKLLTQRDGSLRQEWYGVFTENGKRKVINLDLPWKGIPPESGRVGDEGNDVFEASRKEAEKALRTHAENAARKGRVEHLTERLIESKTGRTVEYTRLEELHDCWRNLGRETPVGERYLSACDAQFKRFTDFMKTRNSDAVRLYEVTPKDAAAFVADIQTGLARKTVRDAIKLLNKSFASFLPVGGSNPFAAFMGRRQKANGETVHRKPFTDAELTALLAAARDDEFMYPLIVTAACSGMRRGDVCCLPWSSVDLTAGMLAVKTSKTGAEVEIPIFKPLRAVLEARKNNGHGLVFPEAARLLEVNPDALTWQFKKIVARALGGGTASTVQEPVPASEVLAEGEAAVMEKLPEGPRRARMLDVFRRYCEGASLREIVKATGHAKCTVSYDLHSVEEMIEKPFLRVQMPSVKKAVRAATQEKRIHGQRAASTRDWHALRSTFVTLALSAGVPVELVRRVTGHATVEVVLKHYFRPDREQFKAALVSAMPKVLTGKRGRMTREQELAALSAKWGVGTATDTEKARVRQLATML